MTSSELTPSCKFRTLAVEETEMKALVVVHEVLLVEVMQHVLGMLDVPDLICAEVVCSAWCGLTEPAWLSLLGW